MQHLVNPFRPVNVLIHYIENVNHVWNFGTKLHTSPTPPNHSTALSAHTLLHSNSHTHGVHMGWHSSASWIPGGLLSLARKWTCCSRFQDPFFEFVFWGSMGRFAKLKGVILLRLLIAVVAVPTKWSGCWRVPEIWNSIQKFGRGGVAGANDVKEAAVKVLKDPTTDSSLMNLVWPLEHEQVRICLVPAQVSRRSAARLAELNVLIKTEAVQKSRIISFLL